MTVSSTRNLCLKATLPLLFAVASPVRARVTTSYKITAESRLSYHAFDPRDIASHRHILDAEQNLTFNSRWSLMAGLRAYADAAFAVNPQRYGPTVRRNESSDIRLRDLFLQYKTPKLLMRLGSQQVVWGEAFGFYYADVVNPKDLRDFGLRDLSAQRLQVPMANAILFFKRASLQVVYVPKPYFNLVPAPDGDFSPWNRLLPGVTVNLVDPRSGALTLFDGDWGVRLTTLLAGYDLGVFLFTYRDRQPVYEAVPAGPGTLELHGRHPRIGTLGFTFSKDLSPWLLRWESTFTKERLFQTLAAGSLGTFRSDELNLALEAEYGALAPWRLGGQLSWQYLSTHVPESLTPRNRGLLSGIVKAPLWREHTLDAILSWALHDGSSLARLQYTVPTSQQFEVMVGADLLLGGAGSQFGLFRSGSRAYVQLKGYLAK